MLSSTFSIPVFSFRHVPTPLESQGIQSYLCVVPVAAIPDRFKDWLEVNAREASLKGRVPQAIRETLAEDPENFVVFNRGLTIVAEVVSYDNQKKEVTLGFRDRDFNGVLDGGHTLAVILDHRQDIGEENSADAYCRLEVMTGLPSDMIVPVVEARNTSRQVASKSLLNLDRRFDDLKSAIGSDYERLVTWKENQDGLVDVREIVGVLTAFDTNHYSDDTHPVRAYSGKEQCLKHFAESPECYERLYPIARDLLSMWDEIQWAVPGQYNEKYNGRFGSLTGCHDLTRPRRLHFIGVETERPFPTGYLYPTLAAFRSMLVENKGTAMWGKGLNPSDLIVDGLAAKIFAGAIVNSINTFRNPTKTGKDSSVWALAYRIAENFYLRA